MALASGLRDLAGFALSGLESSASSLRLPGVSSESSLRDLPHGAARRVLTEGLLLARLAIRLLGYLGLGWKWGMQLARLVLYAVLLLPGFSQMMSYYYLSSRVLRSIMYGQKPRQYLDLYLPPNMELHVAYPVVIYVTGGAWTIGYKAWGALLARRLSDQGVLVACLDYRNFPQGDALDMLEDVNTGIRWVLDRIHRFGGDPDSVTLVGQSAGGHLAGLALIKQAEQEALGQPALGASPAWSPTALRAFVGVSGAFDLVALAEHLHRRGLYKNLFERVMSLTTGNGDDGDGGGGVSKKSGGGGVDGRGGGCTAGGCASACGDGSSAVSLACNGNGCVPGCGSSSSAASGAVQMQNPGGLMGKLKRVGTSHDASGCKGGARPAYAELSPLEVARRLPAAAAALLPYVLLVHGTADKTVPAEGSARLSEALQSAGARCSRCLLVPGKTHTAFLLEDPMRGGRDLLMDTVLGAMTGGGADVGNGDDGSVVFGGGRKQQQAAEQPDHDGGSGSGKGGGAVCGGGGSDNVRQPYHVYGTLCPGWLCDLAGWVCPF